MSAASYLSPPRTPQNLASQGQGGDAAAPPPELLLRKLSQLEEECNAKGVDIKPQLHEIERLCLRLYLPSSHFANIRARAETLSSVLSTVWSTMASELDCPENKSGLLESELSVASTMDLLLTEIRLRSGESQPIGYRSPSRLY